MWGSLRATDWHYYLHIYPTFKPFYCPLKVMTHGPCLMLCSPIVYTTWVITAGMYGILAEWLRRKIRNLLGSARAGSNPADVVLLLLPLSPLGAKPPPLPWAYVQLRI